MSPFLSQIPCPLSTFKTDQPVEKSTSFTNPSHIIPLPIGFLSSNRHLQNPIPTQLQLLSQPSTSLPLDIPNPSSLTPSDHTPSSTRQTPTRHHIKAASLTKTLPHQHLSNRNTSVPSPSTIHPNRDPIQSKPSINTHPMIIRKKNMAH
ncbi:hypothetical protein ACH5RR_008475 [Cinchona calisaya]|uniref:Uncharacterized protein n=1 Tax=Cinchona calisaya TaxID=153742 RepID=A0ABD3AC64_9GENT